MEPDERANTARPPKIITRPTAAPPDAAPPDAADPRAGARNLLVNCIGVRSGDEVLIIREPSALGHYDDASPECVAEEASRLGARVHSIWPPEIDGPNNLPGTLVAAMERADHTVFFSQVGDQVRFNALPGAGSKTMSYALDLDYLGSQLCTTPFALMEMVHAKLVAELAQASRWRITCPNGTDAGGRIDSEYFAKSAPGHFSLKLFPVMIFDPLPCLEMNGRVVITHWLTTTATHRFDRGPLVLETPITVETENARIAHFSGEPALVAKVRNHYREVADHFASEADTVHSWHAGINPRTYYAGNALDNLVRWGGICFGSPRFTHFHTCGDNPGLIVWSLFDATITIDDEVYWRDGRFVFLEREDIQAELERYPDAAGAFEMRCDLGI